MVEYLYQTAESTEEESSSINREISSTILLTRQFITFIRTFSSKFVKERIILTD